MSSDVPPTPPPTDPTASGTHTPGGTTTTPPPPNHGGSHRNPLDEIFGRIRGLGVVRPDDGRWAGGVAAGLARRWDIDVVLVRGVFVALALMGGIGVALYGVAWLLLPQTDGRIHLQAASRGHITAGFIGAVLLSLSALGGGGPGPWHDGYWFGWGFPGGLFLTVLLVGGIWWYARRDIEKNGPIMDGGSPLPRVTPATTTTTTTAAEPGSPVYGTPAPAPGTDIYRRMGEESRRIGEESRRIAEDARLKAENAYRTTSERRAASRPSRRIVRATLGVALLAAAIILVLGNRADWAASPGVVAAATALGVIALGVLVSGFLGRRSAGLAGLGVLLAIATVLGAAAQNAGVDSSQNLTAIGERTWRPTTAAAAEKQFNLGVGEATLYLTDPGIVAGTDIVDVRVRTGVGHLTVVLPDGVASRVDLKLTAGEVRRPDGTTAEMRPNTGNHRESLTSGPGGTPELVVDVEQGVGQLDVTTASRFAGTTGDTSTPAPTSTGTSTPAATATATPTVTPTVTPTAKTN